MDLVFSCSETLCQLLNVLIKLLDFLLILTVDLNVLLQLLIELICISQFCSQLGHLLHFLLVYFNHSYVLLNR